MVVPPPFEALFPILYLFRNQLQVERVQGPLAPMKIHVPTKAESFHPQLVVPPCKPKLPHATLKVPTCHWTFSSSRRIRPRRVANAQFLIWPRELCERHCCGSPRRKLWLLDIELLHLLDVQDVQWASQTLVHPG